MTDETNDTGLTDVQMSLMHEAFDLSDKMGELLRGEKVSVIHAAMSIMTEFLVRHTDLNLEMFIRGVCELKSINDEKPPEETGSISTAIMPPNNGSEN